MRVQLIRKLADRINGIDLSGRIPGDVLDMSERDAASLVAEGWAVREGAGVESGSSSPARTAGSKLPTAPRRKRTR